MSDIKSINITGQAVTDMGMPKKGGRRNTKKTHIGGAEEPVKGVSSVMNVVKGVESPSQIAATAATPNTNSWLKYPAAAPVPPVITPGPSVPNQIAAQSQSGGVKHVKVELKKKVSMKKVQLNPKKNDKKVSKKTMTRKVRKVTLGVSSLHKRLTRAKKVHKEIDEMPIEKLKEKLIKGGLIKENSKAPSNVLRQIARDAEVVAKKAL